jgi:outer membrane protein assembly factor BamA
LLAFSDILGNDHYNILVYNNARTSSDFWKSFNFAVTKLSLGQRINYAYGLFRFSGYYYNPADLYYFEERLGGLLAISYPLSQFSRLEMRQTLSYSDKDWYYTRRQAWLNSSYISFVNDNSLWGATGPMDGRRINITLGNTYDFVFSEVNYLTALIDLRFYQRLSLRTAYAIRMLSLFNEGKEARQFYFGGSWDLRGYRRWSLHGERVFLVSQELRFPLIDAIGVRLPKFSLGFSGIRGALFVDAGNAWNDTLDEVLGSFGLGVRMRLGYFLVLRWDFGRTTDFKTISDNTFTQFFFGWDF